jgi:hypothetical protein
MENNPWEFGWQAVGSIFAALSFLVILILERKKLAELEWGYHLSQFAWCAFFLSLGGLTGWLLSNSIISKIISLILAIAFGWFVGRVSAYKYKEEVNKQRSRRLLVAVTIFWIIGAILAIYIWGYLYIS